MDIEKKQRDLKLIEDVIQKYKDMQSMDDNIKKIFQNTNSPLMDLLYSCLTDIANLTEELITGENYHWIDWYIWENNLGTGKLDVMSNNKTLKVTSIKTLYKVMMEHQH